LSTPRVKYLFGFCISDRKTGVRRGEDVIVGLTFLFLDWIGFLTGKLKDLGLYFWALQMDLVNCTVACFDSERLDIHGLG
jgi:hypothetical protein